GCLPARWSLAGARTLRHNTLTIGCGDQIAAGRRLKYKDRVRARQSSSFMAPGTIPPPTLPPPPPPAESREREQLIQRQLSRTSLQVRLVDLGGSIAVWAIGVLAFFLVAALADHL